MIVILDTVMKHNQYNNNSLMISFTTPLSNWSIHPPPPCMFLKWHYLSCGGVAGGCGCGGGGGGGET